MKKKTTLFSSFGVGGCLLGPVLVLLEGLHLVCPPVAVLGGGGPHLTTLLTHLTKLFIYFGL
jgi:hypothetical protein